ncbi:MAG: WD40 repeat domain-containing protein [Acidobacteriota bacterium]
MTAAVAAAGAVAQSPDHGPAARLYRAAISAADARLRLHETAAARRWLDEAPESLRGWEWRYLQARADESLFAVAAHDRAVTALDVSSDGTLVATADAGGSVKVWSAGDGRAIRVLAGHAAAVGGVRFAADGRRLATSSSDGTVRLWDLESGAESLRLEGVSEGIAAVAWHPSGEELTATGWRRVAGRGVVGVVTVWRPGSSQRREIEHGVKPVVTVAYSPSGDMLAAGTWDYDTAVWDTRTWARPAVLVPPEDDSYKAVQSVAWSPDGALLAVAAKDGATRVWDVAAGTLRRTFSGQAEGEAQSVNGAVFSSGGDRLFVGQGDGTIRGWSLRDGTPSAVLHGHAGPVRAVAVSPRGGALFSAGADGTMRKWLAAPGAFDGSWPTREVVYDAAFGPGGRQVATTGWTGLIEIRDAETGVVLRSWTGHEQSGVRIAWSGDGRWIVTTGNDGRVVLWDAATSARLAVLDSVEGTQVTGLAMHPGSKIVAATTTPGTVSIWDLPDGGVRGMLRDGERPQADLAFDSSGGRLAVGARDGSVAVWNWAEAALVRRLEHGRGTTHPVWSPDGRTLAVGGGDGAITVWEADSGRLLRTLSGHQGSVNAVRFSPDGARIASASGDQSTCLWDARGGDMLVCVPSASQVYNLAWSPDGVRLLAMPLEKSLTWLDAVPLRERVRSDAGAIR